MIFAVDIDGVLCSISVNHYSECIPDKHSIDAINQLYDAGHTINIYTARGTRSGAAWVQFTIDQLKGWGIRYHTLAFGKPHADVFIDDKSFKSVADYVCNNGHSGTVVATSGYFDPLHIGHLELFRLSREYGDRLVVILGNDEGLMKKKGYVFMPAADRMQLLRSVKYVDSVVLSIDGDGTCNRTLQLLKPAVYTKGGTSRGTKEAAVCMDMGCVLITELGEKIRSSSEIVGRSR